MVQPAKPFSINRLYSTSQKHVSWPFHQDLSFIFSYSSPCELLCSHSHRKGQSKHSCLMSACWISCVTFNFSRIRPLYTAESHLIVSCVFSIHAALSIVIVLYIWISKYVGKNILKWAYLNLVLTEGSPSQFKQRYDKSSQVIPHLYPYSEWLPKIMIMYYSPPLSVSIKVIKELQRSVSPLQTPFIQNTDIPIITEKREDVIFH